MFFFQKISKIIAHIVFTMNYENFFRLNFHCFKPSYQFFLVTMTANSFKEDADAAAEAGMDGFVTKPVDVEYLYQVLEGALKR